MTYGREEKKCGISDTAAVEFYTTTTTTATTIPMVTITTPQTITTTIATTVTKPTTTTTKATTTTQKKVTTYAASKTEQVEEDGIEWITFNCSAYCICTVCTNGGGITASGTIPQVDWTIAAGRMYPFGTLIYIEGYGTYCVEDRGGAISNEKIDIYFNTHQDACNFGRRYLKGYIVRWGYEE